jgi:hypothetical protein
MLLFIDENLEEVLREGNLLSSVENKGLEVVKKVDVFN